MIIETIKKQIEKSSLSRYRISQDTGVDQATLSRLMQGKTITVETADILYEYFKLKIVRGNKVRTHKSGQATYRELLSYQERVKSFNMAVNKLVEYTRVQLEIDSSPKRSNDRIIEARKETLRKAMDRINQLAE